MSNFERDEVPRTTAAPCLVIGWGCDLRGDDAAGRRVAGTVAAWARPGVDVLLLHQLTPEVADVMAVARRVVFVDAFAAKGAAAVRLARVRPAGEGRGPTLGHHGAPDALLQMTIDLYGAAPETWQVGVPAYDFERVGTMSPEGAEHLDAAVATVRDLIDRPLS
jgi:hydrogenase maturation protease